MGLFGLFGKKKKAKAEEIKKNSTPVVVKEEKKESEAVKAEPVKAPVIEEAPIAEEKIAKEPAKAVGDEKKDEKVAPKPKATVKKAAPKAAEKATEEVAPAAAQSKAKKAVPAKAEEPEVKEEAVAPVANEEPKKITGRFEIKRTKDERFVFNLYAPNRVIVATSQIYSSSQSAINGIKSIINNAEKSGIEDNTLKEKTTLPFPKWEIYADKAGQFRFRLYATNGSCVVHSQGYTTKSSCKNGIESIIRCSKNPEIDKAYLKKEEK